MTPDGILIDTKLEHLLKAEFPIDLTLDGIKIELSKEHSEKALFPTEMILELFANDIISRLLHPENALLPSVVSLELDNISTDFKIVQ